jgi:hypothetical protein
LSGRSSLSEKALKGKGADGPAQNEGVKGGWVWKWSLKRAIDTYPLFSYPPPIPKHFLILLEEAEHVKEKVDDS